MPITKRTKTESDAAALDEKVRAIVDQKLNEIVTPHISNDPDGSKALWVKTVIVEALSNPEELLTKRLRETSEDVWDELIEEYKPPTPWKAMILVSVISILATLIGMAGFFRALGTVSESSMPSGWPPPDPVIFKSWTDHGGPMVEENPWKRAWGEDKEWKAPALPLPHPYSFKMVNNGPECWVSITQTGSGFVWYESLFRGEKLFDLDHSDRIMVRSGCPGQINFWVDGNKVIPANVAEHPGKIEIAFFEM